MGIVSTDLILLNMIQKGIENLRKNPWQLDFVFEDLVSPILDLEKKYGSMEINNAKRYFLNNDIKVNSAWNRDSVRFPSITIQQLSSIQNRDKAVLGDIAPLTFDGTVAPQNYIPTPRIMAGPFPSINYSATTGLVTLPSSFNTTDIYAGQSLYSVVSGQYYTITSVPNATTFYINTGIIDTFTNSYVAPAYMNLFVNREWGIFDESYEISINVKGDVGELIILHNIITYLILKERKNLLEKQNFSITFISSSPIMANNWDELGAAELIYTRNIRIDGQCEQTWVAELDEYIEGINLSLTTTEPIDKGSD